MANSFLRRPPGGSSRRTGESLITAHQRPHGLGAILVVALVSAVVVQADDGKPIRSVEGWGQVIDPMGDCVFRLQDGALTIEVPEAHHDLWPDVDKVNAPLVLQDVEGDFTVQVLVATVSKSEPNTKLAEARSTSSFHAGTLVIWQDAKNFVRLDRVDMEREGTNIGCYFHVFRDGKRFSQYFPSLPAFVAIPDQPTHLRLKRKQDRVSASYSQDRGQTWKPIRDVQVELPATVKTGVSAINNTSTKNVVRFEGLKIDK
jgi:hypothetical protein